MTKRFWVNSEIVRLRALAKTHTLQEAAKVIGRSHRATALKAASMGISFQKYGEAHHSASIPTAKVLQIFALRNQGLSTREIAEQIGTGPNYVNEIESLGTRYRETLPLVLGEVSA